MEYSTSQSIVFVINVFFSYCICSQFFCTGVQCGSVFVFSVFRAVHTDRKVSGGERRKRDTTDLATQDEQEQYKQKEGKMCWRKAMQSHHLFNHDGKLSLFCPKDGTHIFDVQKVIPKEN